MNRHFKLAHYQESEAIRREVGRWNAGQRSYLRHYRSEAARSSDAIARVECWLSFMSSVSALLPILFVAVDDIKPNRRYASVLKLLILFVSAVAIAKRLIP